MLGDNLELVASYAFSSLSSSEFALVLLLKDVTFNKQNQKQTNQPLNINIALTSAGNNIQHLNVIT